MLSAKLGDFRRLGGEIPQKLRRHNIRGPEKKAVRNGPALQFILTAEVPHLSYDSPTWSDGDTVWWQIHDQFGREINRWGEFPTCKQKRYICQSLSSLSGDRSATEPVKKVSIKMFLASGRREGATKFHQISKNTSSLCNLGLFQERCVKSSLR